MKTTTAQSAAPTKGFKSLHALSHDKSVDKVTQACSDTIPDAGETVNNAILRTANNNTVTYVRADVGAAHQQERAFLGGGDILIKVVGFATAEPADQ